MELLEKLLAMNREQLATWIADAPHGEATAMLAAVAAATREGRVTLEQLDVVVMATEIARRRVRRKGFQVISGGLST